ncbi:MAG: ABC transporter permease [Chloroflexi bacterium]|nr:ABC transporter permease [Chloroflexota bacterium]
MNVSNLVITRLFQTLLVLFGELTVVFFMLRLAPGDPAQMMLPEGAPPEAIARLREVMGLNRPLPEQYVTFLTGALAGDLGTSFRFEQPTLPLVMERLPATLQLAFAALAIALAIAVPLGIVSALRHNSLLDVAATLLALFGLSMPNFWLGLMFILIFSLNFRLLPTSGYGTPQQLVMPAVTLGLYFSALTARLVRSQMLEVMHADFVRTARSKGLREWRVVVGHCLKNALIPVITVVGLQLGGLLGGAVVVESIFGWPGVGRLVFEAIRARDYPLVQAVVFVVAMVFVLINLVVDLIYLTLDPRIRYT